MDEEETFGYSGKILRVNLTNGKIREEPVIKYAKRLIGGRGINSYLLFTETPPRINAFDPENRLIFGTGPLVGTMVPMSCRFTVTAKSPLTGGLGDANAGGHFSPELKYAGFDHVVITGRAPNPVFLLLDNGNAEIRDANEIWNATTFDTDTLIREEVGDSDIQVASIGPAGENLVRFANIICNRKRACGRTGMGAVMGSKNLKAVAVRGDGLLEVAEPEKFMQLVDEKLQILLNNESLKALSKLGGMGLVKIVPGYENDILRNFQGGDFNLDDVSGEKLFKDHHVHYLSCFNCPIHCYHFLRIEDGEWAGIEGPGMEYNAVIDFGYKLDIHDLRPIIKAQIFCNQQGLDIDDSSGLISWAIECFKKGIINLDDTDGLTLDWGDPSLVMSLLEKITVRKGFGNILAEGIKRASNRVGKESEKYAIHIKGLTVMDALRTFKGWMFGEVVSPRGAEHLRGTIGGVEEVAMSRDAGEEFFGVSTAGDPSAYEGKVELVIYFERLSAIVNALNMCYFTSKWSSPSLLDIKDYAELFSAATGWDFSENDLVKVADRIINVEKAFNVREGLTRKDDTLPARFFEEPVPSGPMKGAYIEEGILNAMLDKYYKIRGWSERDGLQTEETLKELELGEISDKLKLGVNMISTDNK